MRAFRGAAAAGRARRTPGAGAEPLRRRLEGRAGSGPSRAAAGRTRSSGRGWRRPPGNAGEPGESPDPPGAGGGPPVSPPPQPRVPGPSAPRPPESAESRGSPGPGLLPPAPSCAVGEIAKGPREPRDPLPVCPEPPEPARAAGSGGGRARTWAPLGAGLGQTGDRAHCQEKQITSQTPQPRRPGATGIPAGEKPAHDRAEPRSLQVRPQVRPQGSPEGVRRKPQKEQSACTLRPRPPPGFALASEPRSHDPQPTGLAHGCREAAPLLREIRSRVPHVSGGSSGPRLPPGVRGAPRLALPPRAELRGTLTPDLLRAGPKSVRGEVLGAAPGPAGRCTGPAPGGSGFAGTGPGAPSAFPPTSSRAAAGGAGRMPGPGGGSRPPASPDSPRSLGGPGAEGPRTRG
ncbi:translation initiation factor IF-2-like [Talpa occidentalis]|uniref:translation initiation factor IF-2-like n=1 Tax=Talpa occidentalis TaxID=50954 RepID=UPI00188F6B66|nr:translation initiation factor IF-2-like [Talpa occidentalis]